MLDILYFLLAVSCLLTGGFIYRLTRGAREWRRREHGAEVGARFGIESEQAREAELDLAYLRWSFIAWGATSLWAFIIGLILLFNYITT